MGSINPIKFCLDEVEKLAQKGHFGAALIYLVQAAEIAAKKYLEEKRGLKLPYFSACIPYLKEIGVINDEEEKALYGINTLRNLAIHSAKPISQEEFKKASEKVKDLLKKLKQFSLHL